MQCILKKNCFEQSNKCYLSVLIGLISKESEYNSVTVDDSDIFSNVVFNSMYKEDRDILIHSFSAGLNRSSPYEGEEIVVDTNGLAHDKCKIFTLSEAIDYLKQPLTILLENDRYDGRFVRCIISQFGNQRIKEALRKNTIRMGLSGGCGNTKNTLDESLRGFSYRPKFLRYFVIWDSDKKFPSESITKYNDDISNLNDMGIKYHILNKREMENYLPENAVYELAFPSFIEWFNAYKSLSDEQKDYYDMNDGFKYSGTSYDISNRNLLPNEIKSLFDNVSDTNFNILKDGLKIAKFKDTFTNSFQNSGHANKRELLERTASQTNPQELQGIVDVINKLL